MRILALDVETTTKNKGHVYDPDNELVCWSGSRGQKSWSALWDEHSALDLQEEINEAQLIVGFNFKFDLAWFRRVGIKGLSTKQIWDVQLAEFILSNQTWRFPSLNETCAKYGIELKKDIVKTEYWDKGIDTKDIPWPILEEYAAHDAYVTLRCYEEQRKVMTPAQVKLCFLQCQDLVILQDMEQNGIPFDEELCKQRSLEVDDKISEIKGKLSSLYPDIPINFGSNDHLSAFLYGGTIKEDGKEHIGFYKTGLKAGQPKYKNIVIEHKLPRMYTPLKGSEMAKEGIYAVDEATLRKLKGKKDIINLILELSKLEKLNGTYYKGLVALREEMCWEPGVLHGQFNQCIAQTGRLSSSRPNLQNMAGDIQDIFISRYQEFY